MKGTHSGAQNASPNHSSEFHGSRCRSMLWMGLRIPPSHYSIVISKLINKSARELVKIQEQARDVEAYLAAVEKSLGRKFGFNIDIADYNLVCEWYICTALKMIVIACYCRVAEK